MIVVIDNYDSFTYNIVQYIGEWEDNIRVFRNDKITAAEVDALSPEAIILSPGPGNPKDAGISLEILNMLKGKYPILGVCLGHQCIGEAFGGVVTNAKQLMHGKTSSIQHDGLGIFKDVAMPFDATRYHSLIVERKSLPKELTVSAWTRDGEIMGLRHKKYLIEGVQFHPESILTREGKKILRNFIRHARKVSK